MHLKVDLVHSPRLPVGERHYTLLINGGFKARKSGQLAKVKW